MEPSSAVKILRKDVEVACVQFASGTCKSTNIATARAHVLTAARHGAKIVVLPECFNSPYSTPAFPKYAEVFNPMPSDERDSPTFFAMSRMARDAKIYLVGGSIPERQKDSDMVFNTSVVFDPSGVCLGQHRKAHLFNVDFPGFTFRESDALSRGNSITVVDLEDYGKIGLGICFDIRFPEPAMIAARSGAFCLVYPSAFSSTTGPLHWELLGRSRALDNQLYVLMSSQAYDPTSQYPAWGHSMLVDPSGQLLASAAQEDAIVYACLRNDALQQCRRELPLDVSRRFDLYPDVSQAANPSVDGISR
ncbi:nitrilase family protein [Stagonosporopsis vannaccii]|nr:nitrilase family protein [Stagonosporopsis vannaccii]